MQKDFHFNLTHSLAIQAGIDPEEALIIAWANQFTDDLVEADVYGIQTQCKEIGNWIDPQIQFSVLVPFHFLPGDDPDWQWKTTENCSIARKLIENAIQSKNPFQFGIALHAMQDTFSHQGFSGWQEDNNSCYPWYYLKSALPNMGHTEMMTIPDMIEQVWIDPRTQQRIDNKERALRAARRTFDIFLKWNKDAKCEWHKLELKLRGLFKISDYDERKKQIIDLSDDTYFRYSRISKKFRNKNLSQFIQAARVHLSNVFIMIE